MSANSRKTDKAWELFFLMTLNDEFDANIRKIRGNFAIPEGGCSTKENAEKWLAQGEKSSVKFYERHFHKAALLAAHRLPPTPDLMNLLEDYILSGYRFKMTRDAKNLSFALEIPTEKDVKHIGRSYVKIWIYDMASREDAINYIRKRWTGIKLAMHHQNRVAAAKRINPVQNKLLVRAVITLDRLSIEALRRITKQPKGVYRSSLICSLLNKDTFPSITPKAVGKLLEHYGPYRRGHLSWPG